MLSTPGASLPLPAGAETRDFVRFALVAAIALVVLQLLRAPPPLPVADALHYIDYALNLYRHGIYGLSPRLPGEVLQPGAGNAPLYPALLAALIALVPDTAAGLECARVSNGAGPCEFIATPFVVAHSVLVWLTLLATWLLARRIFAGRATAWLAPVVVLLSGEPLYYSDGLLTENLTVPLFAWFSLALITLVRRGTARIALAVGALGAALTLTRPEFLYLAVATVGVLLLGGVLARRDAWRRGALLAAIAFVLVVSPWLARNAVQLGRPAITVGYAEHILSERLSYNRMGWYEWAAAFLYWFPDIGDSLARDLLPERLYARLGWSPGSYYLTSYVVRSEANAATSSRDEVFPWLMREKVLGDAPKHLAVTLALAWRGMFIAKWWGVFAWICVALALWRGDSERRRTLALVLAPGVFMVMFYAGVSVSVPRYNLVLVPVLSTCSAWLLAGLARRAWAWLVAMRRSVA